MKVITLNHLRKTLTALLLIVSVKGIAQDNKAFNCEKLYSSDQKARNQVYSAIHTYLTQFSIYKINAGDIYNYVQSAEEEKQFNLNKDGEILSFHLSLSDLFTPDYTVRVITNEGIVEQAVPLPGTYKGYVNGKPENNARVSIREDYFLGIYRIDNVEYSIQPISAFMIGGRENEYVFFKLTDRKNTGAGICDFELDKKAEPSPLGPDEMNEEKINDPSNHKDKSDDRKSTSLAWYCAEVAFLVDSTYYVKSGSSASVATTRVTDIFNLVVGFYNTLQVSQKLSEIVIDATGASKVVFKSTNATYGNVYMIDPIQSAFATWGNKVGNFKNKFDLAVLATGADIVSPTVGPGLIGRSTIGGACGTNKYSIVEYYPPWANDYSKHRVCMAHEMGHNYNGTHVSNCTTCILTPSLSGTETQWGTQNTNEITAFVPGKSPACFTAGQCVTTGIEKNSKNEGLIIYPNPSNGIFTIEHATTKKGNAKVMIHNLLGELIYSKDIPVNISKAITIDLSKETKGVYLMRITGDDFQLNRSLIIE